MFYAGKGVPRDAQMAVVSSASRWRALIAPCLRPQCPLLLRFTHLADPCVAFPPPPPYYFVVGQHWYRTAAKNGCPSAMNNLGICYEDGCGVRQELEEAKRLYRLASELGNAQAKTNLGCIYVQEERHQEAAHLFRAAGDLGNTDGARASRA